MKEILGFLRNNLRLAQITVFKGPSKMNGLKRFKEM